LVTILLVSAILRAGPRNTRDNVSNTESVRVVDFRNRTVDFDQCRLYGEELLDESCGAVRILFRIGQQFGLPELPTSAVTVKNLAVTY
jgi:hypothetical protein